MGKIRPDYIKRPAKEIMKEYGHLITTDFEANKKFVDEYIDVSTKRMRNKLAGYLVTLKKNESKIIIPPKYGKKPDGDKKKKKQFQKWV
jgi:small subunit ribosomal protein S17e